MSTVAIFERDSNTNNDILGHHTHNQDGVINDAHGSDDELAYSHISDEELTMGSEISNLRSTRSRLWDAPVSSGLTLKALAIAKNPKTASQNLTSVAGMVTLPTAASVASATSAASAVASAQATKATKVAKKLAYKAMTTTTAAGKSEILNRFINGSAQAPGQVLSWMSTGLARSKTNISAGTAFIEDIDSSYDLVIRPAGRAVTINSIYTIPTPISPFTTSAFSTPPNSRSGSVNPSLTGLTSTCDEIMEPTECDIMSAGTLFERNSAGAIVPVLIDDDFNEAATRNFEVVFDDKDDAGRDFEENEDNFCILAPMSENTD
ncbi:hypothetical protein SBRCBS47491_002528 [Sporothrix bragantina]|uniref:Uncharacterized protein n=1 Tax=Sporothrix bragantina TaxID=671064 RepID=A0ABP0B7M3_9PEZI